MSDTGAKGRSTANEDEFQKLQKLQNASIACGPTALVLKKSATRGGKDRSRADNCKISKSSKSEKGVDCL